MRRAAAISVLALIAVSGAAYVVMNANTFVLFGSITSRVETSERLVALTFDDGPTAKALDVSALLAEHEGHATFFVVGGDLSEQQDVGRQLVAEGHELGNHSWSHQRMLLMPRARIAEEIERTDQVIRSVGFTGEILFRPPYGKKLFGLPRYLGDHGRRMIMADVEPESDPAAAADAQQIADIVVEQVRPGSIVVLHPMFESNGPTREALPEILDRLADEGYRFVTVSELLARESDTPA